jgi:hypothetical protein
LFVVLAATTLVAAGLLMSTFDFVSLLLVGAAVFLLTSDFFSIAIFAFSRINLTALRNTLVQADGQTTRHAKPPKNDPAILRRQPGRVNN